jgi:DNA mismatch repair protein MutS
MGMAEIRTDVQTGDSECFGSILFDKRQGLIDAANREEPEFFADLNLDQIVDSVTTGRDEYDLKPFFYIPLKDVETINYRHDVLRDLENQNCLKAIRSFAEQMRAMREQLAQAGRLAHDCEKHGWFRDAIETYHTAVEQLAGGLARGNVCSRGLRSFLEYLTNYTRSDVFTSLVADAEKVKAELSAIRYCLRIDGMRIEVSRYEGQDDYGADVLRTFERFKQGPAREYRFGSPSGIDMNLVEAAILDLVARLYPDVFSALEACCIRHKDYIDLRIADFDRDVEFYLACLDYIEPFKRAGLAFCYPCVTTYSREVSGTDVFDLALAGRLICENKPVVTNDFYLRDPERILVVSGANQGGKTTFARTFGQLHYLACLGCQVPGSQAHLHLFDQLFTHFEREEDIRKLTGKLEDDLLRIRHILKGATRESVIILNESFLSTTMHDALFLSRELMQRIIERGSLCVSVTYLDAVASISEAIVSMVTTVDPKDPAVRTFKIVRGPADGRAYAMAIAEKYQLTYENTRERLAGNQRRV